MPVLHPPQTREVRVGDRLAYIDNLRVALTALVVAHHVALAYGNLGLWPNWQQPASTAAGLPLDLFVLLNQSFFMGFFFLLSGLFVPRSGDRRGPGGLARERLRRLAIPLAAALVLVRGLYTLPEYLAEPAAVRPPYWEFFLTHWNIGPLWFLGVLLVFTLVYALLRRLTPAGPTAASTGLRPVPVVLVTLGLEFVLYLWRIAVPVGTSVLGIPSAAHLPQYAALFVVGVLAYRRGWLAALPERTGLLGGGMILASLVPMVLGEGTATLLNEAGASTAALPHLGFALWEALFGIGAILVLIALFRRFVTSDGPFATFLARNAFAVYLVHAPVIVGIVALLAPLQLAPAAGFAIVLPAASAASWLLAALLRRLPGVRSVL